MKFLSILIISNIFLNTIGLPVKSTPSRKDGHVIHYHKTGLRSHRKHIHTQPAIHDYEPHHWNDNYRTFGRAPANPHAVYEVPSNRQFNGVRDDINVNVYSLIERLNKETGVTTGNQRNQHFRLPQRVSYFHKFRNVLKTKLKQSIDIHTKNSIDYSNNPTGNSIDNDIGTLPTIRDKTTTPFHLFKSDYKTVTLSSSTESAMHVMPSQNSDHEQVTPSSTPSNINNPLQTLDKESVTSPNVPDSTTNRLHSFKSDIEIETLPNSTESGINDLEQVRMQSNRSHADNSLHLHTTDQYIAKLTSELSNNNNRLHSRTNDFGKVIPVRKDELTYNNHMHSHDSPMNSHNGDHAHHSKKENLESELDSSSWARTQHPLQSQISERDKRGIGDTDTVTTSMFTQPTMQHTLIENRLTLRVWNTSGNEENNRKYTETTTPSTTPSLVETHSTQPNRNGATHNIDSKTDYEHTSDSAASQRSNINPRTENVGITHDDLVHLKGIHVTFSDGKQDTRSNIPTIHLTASISSTENVLKPIASDQNVQYAIQQQSETTAKHTQLSVDKIVGTAVIRDGHLYLIVHPFNVEKSLQFIFPNQKDVSMKTPTEPLIKTPTEPLIKPSTEPLIKPSTEPLIKPSTEPLIKTSTEPLIKTSTEPLIKTPAEPLIIASTEPLIKPSTEPLIKPSTKPLIKPSTEPLIKTSTEPLIKTSTEPLIKTSTEPLIKTSTETLIKTSTEPLIKTSTEPLIKEIHIPEPLTMIHSEHAMHFEHSAHFPHAGHIDNPKPITDAFSTTTHISETTSTTTNTPHKHSNKDTLVNDHKHVPHDETSHSHHHRHGHGGMHSEHIHPKLDWNMDKVDTLTESNVNEPIERFMSPWNTFNLSSVFPYSKDKTKQSSDDDIDVNIVSFTAMATDPFDKIKKILTSIANNTPANNTKSNTSGEASYINSNAETAFNFELKLNGGVAKQTTDTNSVSQSPGSTENTSEEITIENNTFNITESVLNLMTIFTTPPQNTRASSFLSSTTKPERIETVAATKHQPLINQSLMASTSAIIQTINKQVTISPENGTSTTLHPSTININNTLVQVSTNKTTGSSRGEEMIKSKILDYLLHLSENIQTVTTHMPLGTTDNQRLGHVTAATVPSVTAIPLYFGQNTLENQNPKLLLGINEKHNSHAHVAISEYLAGKTESASKHAELKPHDTHGHDHLVKNIETNTINADLKHKVPHNPMLYNKESFTHKDESRESTTPKNILVNTDQYTSADIEMKSGIPQNKDLLTKISDTNNVQLEPNIAQTKTLNNVKGQHIINLHNQDLKPAVTQNHISESGVPSSNIDRIKHVVTHPNDSINNQKSNSRNMDVNNKQRSFPYLHRGQSEQIISLADILNEIKKIQLQNMQRFNINNNNFNTMILSEAEQKSEIKNPIVVNGPVFNDLLPSDRHIPTTPPSDNHQISYNNPAWQTNDALLNSVNDAIEAMLVLSVGDIMADQASLHGAMVLTRHNSDSSRSSK